MIGAQVSAKISCRLVADQDPQKIYDALKRFLNDRTPPDCRWDVRSHGMSPAIRVPTESPYLRAAMAGLALALCYMAKRGDNRMKKHFDGLRKEADKNR